MEVFEYTVSNPEGVHGRAAVDLVECVSGMTSRVTVENGDKRTYADRLYGLLSPGARQGDRLRITVEGENAPADALRLKAFYKAHI